MCSFVFFRGTSRVLIAAGSGADTCSLPASAIQRGHIIDGHLLQFFVVLMKALQLFRCTVLSFRGTTKVSISAEGAKAAFRCQLVQ